MFYRFLKCGIQRFLTVDTAKFQDIFIVFFHNDIDDIINSDNSKNRSSMIDNRQRIQVIAADKFCSVFLVIFRMYKNRFFLHDIFDFRIFICCQKDSQVGCTDKLSASIDDIDCFNNFTAVGNLSDFRHTSRHCIIFFQCDVAGIHDTSGTVRRIIHQCTDDLTITFKHLINQCFSLYNRQISDQIGNIILLHIAEYINQFIICNGLNHSDCEFFLCLFQNSCQVFRLQQITQLP